MSTESMKKSGSHWTFIRFPKTSCILTCSFWPTLGGWDTAFYTLATLLIPSNYRGSKPPTTP